LASWPLWRRGGYLTLLLLGRAKISTAAATGFPLCLHHLVRLVWCMLSQPGLGFGKADTALWPGRLGLGTAQLLRAFIGRESGIASRPDMESYLFVSRLCSYSDQLQSGIGATAFRHEFHHRRVVSLFGGHSGEEKAAVFIITFARATHQFAGKKDIIAWSSS
jgi:hypothetical protein